MTVVAPDATPAPAHVAVIMDGNGRWAKRRFRPRAFGHKAGRSSVDRIVTACAKAGVKTLSLYAFSTENWTRPEKEVAALMTLIESAIREEADKMYRHGIRLQVIGNREGLSDSLNLAIDEAEKMTAACCNMNVVLAINYSGHWAIAETAKRIAALAVAGEIDLAKINEQVFHANRPLPEFPPVDLLIRSSGEMRISNFHLWELAYAELYFTDVLWPDFDEIALQQAFAAYHKRNRRFGGLCEEDNKY